jgi:large subunit ribosomal protein L3
MASYNSPRRGSMAFYPRVRARKETPSLKAQGKEAKALSFLCYKVGMTQVIGQNNHKGSPSFGQEVAIPATIVECPPLKVLGVRAYVKDEIGYRVLTDVIADNIDKEVKRKIKKFKEKSKKEKKKKEGKEKETKKEYKIDDLAGEDIEYLSLLVYTQAKSIKLKKKVDIVEINIGGKKEEQLNYAKEILGKEINIEDVFEEGNFLDVKGVTKGKGFQGVIKRFGVKIQRPKAKTRRIVGSISPWNPSTVMFTVPRPGQMGYHNRTESNKKLLKISDKLEEVNGKAGFSGYGKVRGKYAVITGSLPGARKRCLAIRKGTRPVKKSGKFIENVEKILVK